MLGLRDLSELFFFPLFTWQINELGLKLMMQKKSSVIPGGKYELLEFPAGSLCPH